MADNFQPCLDHLLKDESGAYVADDNGRGPSKWGITWKTAEAYGYLSSPDQIQNLTREQAAVFYRLYFWHVMRLDLIESLPLASRLFNLGVNISQHGVVMWLQDCVNMYSIRVKVDGWLGPITASVVNALPAESLLACVKGKAELFYRKLATDKPELYGRDLKSWLARLAGPDV